MCFRFRKKKGISKYMYKDARRRIEHEVGNNVNKPIAVFDIE
jgi:hypothetical protein